jgi:hypothetical protein
VATAVFVMPIIPGKEELDRQTLQGLSTPGPEHDAYAATRRAQGVTREAVWHQATPMGTFAIVLMEGDDLAGAMAAMTSSDDPFNAQFREFVKDVHGVDLATDGAPDITPIIDNRF